MTGVLTSEYAGGSRAEAAKSSAVKLAYPAGRRQLGNQRAATDQELRDLRSGRGPREQEPLSGRAVEGSQKRKLLRSLDALGKRMHPEALRELEHCADRRTRVPVEMHILHKRAVNLQDVDRQIFSRPSDEYPVPKSSMVPVLGSASDECLDAIDVSVVEIDDGLIVQLPTLSLDRPAELRVARRSRRVASSGSPANTTVPPGPIIFDRCIDRSA